MNWHEIVSKDIWHLRAPEGTVGCEGGGCGPARVGVSRPVVLTGQVRDGHLTPGGRAGNAARYDRAMAEAEGTLQEQLDEIGVQLSWVRDYL
jgi:hypothetical protein